MVTTRTYRYLIEEPEKGMRQLFIRDTGVSASDIWRDCNVNGLTPEESAAGRDIPLVAVREALDYCDIEWDVILRDRDDARTFLEDRGLLATQ